MKVFTLESTKITLYICLLNLFQIQPHEETIPELIESLSKDISNTGIQRHPIIIDKKSSMILDGMHRAKALEKIGCTRILSCLVDYDSPEILVKRWFRTIKGIINEKKIRKILVKLKLKASESNVKKALTLLNESEGVCALISSKSCYLIENNGDLENSFDIIKKLEVELNRYGKVDYEIEMDALKSLEKGIINYILAIPKIKKRDLIQTSKRGYLLPRKTTRHIIPTRPLDINIPVKLLQDQHITLEQANQKLIELLESKRVERILPGSIIEERKYEEELLIFKDKM